MVFSQIDLRVSSQCDLAIAKLKPAIVIVEQDIRYGDAGFVLSPVFSFFPVLYEAATYTHKKTPAVSRGAFVLLMRDQKTTLGNHLAKAGQNQITAMPNICRPMNGTTPL